MCLGIGLAINNAKAVIEALLNQESGFTRTPKTGSEGKNAKAVQKTYRGKASWLPAIELAFGVYFTFAAWYAWDMAVYNLPPVPGAFPGRLPLRRPVERFSGPLRERRTPPQWVSEAAV